ncbi:MAG: hypothetical protein M3186_01080, partial [Actinomycetota bacterium]|nr:hypothetical protein [Actinomycetota bacterium]
ISESYFLDANSVAEGGVAEGGAAEGAAAHRMSRDIERSWLDTPGVIGDLSPRAAAASQDPAIRAELRSTVDDVEATWLQIQRTGQSTTGLMSAHRLRDALGLDNDTR